MDRVDLLRAFITVADTGTFTSAAERLGTTPQLVSKYIRVLEDQWDAQLFIRSTRNVRLTETGRACLERCARWVEDFDELSADIRQEHREPQGKLRITAPTTFGEEFLAPLLPKFLQCFPRVSIDLNLTDRFVNLIEGYDVALRIGTLEDSSLIARRIASSPIIMCASPGYIQKHGRPSEPTELSKHRCVVDSNFRSGENWPFTKAGETTQVKVHNIISVNSASAVRNILLRDAGIGPCPAFVVRDHLQTGKLIQLFDEYEIVELGLYAVYLENRYLSAKIRAFVDFLVEQLGTLP